MSAPHSFPVPRSTVSRKLSRGILFCLLTGLCGCGVSCSDEEEETAEDKELVPTVLQAIREPEEDQFPDPESAVRFLLDQIKKRDVNEAARVFPIKERYNYANLAETSRHLRMYTFRDTPIPGAEFHNLQLAIAYLGDIYEEVSIICLGLDPNLRTDLKEHSIESEIETLREQFDYSKLGNLEIRNIEVTQIEETTPDQGLYRAMGAKNAAIVEVEVHCISVDKILTFRLFEIDDNWRISDLYDARDVDE